MDDFFFQCLNGDLLFLFITYLDGEEEGHNWIFSADQLEDEAGGME